MLIGTTAWQKQEKTTQFIGLYERKEMTIDFELSFMEIGLYRMINKNLKR